MSENGKPQILLISFKPQNIFPLSFFYSKSFVHIDILLLCLIDTSYNKLKKFPR